MSEDRCSLLVMGPARPRSLCLQVPCPSEPPASESDDEQDEIVTARAPGATSPVGASAPAGGRRVMESPVGVVAWHTQRAAWKRTHPTELVMGRDDDSGSSFGPRRARTPSPSVACAAGPIGFLMTESGTCGFFHAARDHVDAAIRDQHGPWAKLPRPLPLGDVVGAFNKVWHDENF
mmetsp:Transcript_27084/g.70161  ORF Transcript_27084/g.70161 Transcript_27084/m.70161 type:complete len:177 (+) Transcript_27084:45-575(+)